MKLLMDADCLIKITKAGIKEPVAVHFEVTIPGIVEREVVADGKGRNCADAFIVENNISGRVISVLKGRKKFKSGDEALPILFKKDKFDAVATDDAKLIRRLKAGNIPFMVPGVILYQMAYDKIFNLKEALAALDRLSEYISEEESSAVRLLLEALK